MKFYTVYLFIFMLGINTASANKYVLIEKHVIAGASDIITNYEYDEFGNKTKEVELIRNDRQTRRHQPQTPHRQSQSK